MLGKTATFFNRNPTVPTTIIIPSSNRLVQQIATNQKNEKIKNVVHVTMIVPPVVAAVAAEEGMIITEKIGIVIGGEMMTQKQIEEEMMIREKEIDIGDQGDRRVERNRGVEVGANHRDVQITRVVEREVVQKQVIPLQRNMKGPATKWRI